jgi:hypothetical protein
VAILISQDSATFGNDHGCMAGCRYGNGKVQLLRALEAGNRAIRQRPKA